MLTHHTDDGMNMVEIEAGCPCIDGNNDDGQGKIPGMSLGVRERQVSTGI